MSGKDIGAISPPPRAEMHFIASMPSSLDHYWDKWIIKGDNEARVVGKLQMRALPMKCVGEEPGPIKVGFSLAQNVRASFVCMSQGEIKRIINNWRPRLAVASRMIWPESHLYNKARRYKRLHEKLNWGGRQERRNLKVIDKTECICLSPSRLRFSEGRDDEVWGEKPKEKKKKKQWMDESHDRRWHERHVFVGWGGARGWRYSPRRSLIVALRAPCCCCLMWYTAGMHASKLGGRRPRETVF